MKSTSSRHVNDHHRLCLCRLQEVGLICSEGLKRCFEIFVHPEIASESNFHLESHLVTCFTKFDPNLPFITNHNSIELYTISLFNLAIYI